MSVYTLNEKEEDKYLPKLNMFIANQEDNSCIDFTDTTLNIPKLEVLLINFGYTQMEFESNGWQYDFKGVYAKTEPCKDLDLCKAVCNCETVKKPNLVISGSGYYATLFLEKDS